MNSIKSRKLQVSYKFHLTDKKQHFDSAGSSSGKQSERNIHYMDLLIKHYQRLKKNFINKL